MKCVVCNHKCDEQRSGHKHCQTHAPCAHGWQYSSLHCVVCEDLFNTALDFEYPDVAIEAYVKLKDWVQGFVRNTEHRPQTLDVFLYTAERDDFDYLRMLVESARIIRAWDSAAASPTLVDSPQTPTSDIPVDVDGHRHETQPDSDDKLVYGSPDGVHTLFSTPP